MSLNIPNSVTSIGYHAFNGCTGLTSINVEKGNSKYDSRDNCNAIIETESNTLITGCNNTIIPNSITSIGDGAFSGCAGLTNITIPNSVTSIEDFTFSGCTGLTNITIPNSVTSIGAYAFEGCTGLTSITIPNSVTSIGGSAFKGCTCLTSIAIPNSVYRIGNSAFFGCTDLTSVSINANNIVSKSSLRDIFGEQVKEYIVGNSVTSIGSGVFSSCYGLTSITIPNSVTSIGKRAFEDCTSLTNITIPNSVTSIGESAFEDCTSLTSIFIPNSVNSIGQNVFEGCTSLASISINNNKIVSKSYTSPYIYTSPSTIKDIFGIQVKEYIIGDSVTAIGDYAFYGCYSLTSITIPNSVTSIGESAFGGCTDLTSVNITDLASWCKIKFNNLLSQPLFYAKYLYLNGNEIKELVIPNSVTSIGVGAFMGCTGLTNITIPNSVTSIGDLAFRGCTGLTNITIPNSVTSIGVHAFEGCTGLTSITIPNSVTSIEYGAFWGCSGLTSVTIPNFVTSIGEYAFRGCTGLTNITIPNSVNSIENKAFYGCSGLTSVSINANRIVSSTYTSSSSLKDIFGNQVKEYIIGDSVTSIGSEAFSGCTGLRNIAIPNSVTSIGYYAFRDCKSLSSVTIPNSVTNIRYWAFQDCTAMTYLESSAVTPPVCESNALDGINKQNCLLCVPEVSLSAYQSAEQWKDFFFISTLTTDPLLKDMFQLRIKSDSIISSYYYGTIIENDNDLSEAAFTTPPTGLLTSASQLTSNAIATNEGSYEALLDGDQSTFFHTTWKSGSGNSPNEDHYLQIDLNESVESIAIKYGARGSIDNYVNPKDITIYATNNVNGNWTQITTATLTYDNNSNGKGLLSIDLGGKYRYIRISVLSNMLGNKINGHPYWCLGELRIYNIGADSQESEEESQVPKEVIDNLQNCINAANEEISSNAATQSTYDALLAAYNTFLSYLSEESTDIEHVKIEPSVDVWFDLQGRRITKPQTSGIYIHNGRKVWVK